MMAAGEDAGALRKRPKNLHTGLVWADVASSLSRHSDVWVALDGDEVVGLAFAFRLWPDTPSLGVKGRNLRIEESILWALIQQGHFSRGYVICDEAQLPLYRACGVIATIHHEQQFTLMTHAWDPLPTPEIRPAHFDEVRSFYLRCGAEAWHPAQFETGPYFVVELYGQVVAAAGMHLSFPGLAQLGNVLTDPAYRGRGFGRQCTAGVVSALKDQGIQVCSLFVAADNAPALAIYKSLVFDYRRTLAAFTWQARGI